MSAPEYRRIVAVDFDGTLAETSFPEIIRPIEKNMALCRRLQKHGAILILWTCRCGQDLTDAVEWCAANGLEFDYINENVPENVEKWGNDSRKVFAHEYIDDKATNPDRERAWARRLRRAYAGKISVYFITAFCVAAAAAAITLCTLAR